LDKYEKSVDTTDQYNYIVHVNKLMCGIIKSRKSLLPGSARCRSRREERIRRKSGRMRNIMSKWKVWSISATVIGFAGSLLADIIQFNPSADTFILDQVTRNENAGANVRLIAGPNSAAGNVYRSLIRFDVSSLSNQYASIDSATLTFTHDGTSKLRTNGTITLNLFLLDNSNKDWIQGTDTFATDGSTGAAVWNYLAYDANNPVAWSGGAGIGNSTASAGISTLLGSVNIVNNDVAVGGKVSFTLNSTGLAAIESWINGGDNAGFFIATDEGDAFQNAVLFGSKEHATAAYRPELAVTYTIPEPTTLGLFLISSIGVFGDRKVLNF